MNGKKTIFRRAASLLIALAILALAGCAAKPAPEQPAAPAETQAETQKPAETQTAPPTDGNDEPQPPADDAIHVASVQELLEAIAPDTKLVVEPGRYDLTEFLRDYPNARDQDEWNDRHPYVKLGFVYDGVEATVTDVSGLCITGGADAPADTEIVTEPRYAAVLNFESCSDVELSCLTMGHTEMGDCTGNVLDFVRCQDVRLIAVDLYGCGVYGVHADTCGDISVSNSVIRDCESGPLWIENSTGDFALTGCTLSGSGWGGSYEPTRASRLAFDACVFGDGESSSWYFRNDAAFRNCEWGEILSYPDREGPLDDSYGFYPEQMKQIAFGDSLLGRGNWIGYAVVDPQSGETEYPGLMGQDALASMLAALNLEEDGTGWLVLGGEETQLTWESMDGDMTLCLRCPERNLCLSRYAADGGAGNDWLMMQYDNDLIWFY